MKRLIPVLLLLACRSAVGVPDSGSARLEPDAGRPPAARRAPTTTELHGEARTDDYAWMKGRSPEVDAYLRAENTWAEQVLAPHQSTHAKVRDWLSARLVAHDDTLAWQRRGWRHWYRSEGDYGLVLRAPTDGGAEQVVLDENAAADGGFADFGTVEWSDDDHAWLYTIDRSGDRDATLLFSLADGGALDHPIAHVSSATWAGANAVLYTTQDDAKRANRLWLHRLGQAKDTLLQVELDEKFDLSVSRSQSERYALVTAGSLQTSEVWLIDVKHPEVLVPLLPRQAGRTWDVDHAGAAFVARVNDQGPDFRVVEFTRPGAPLRELVPTRDDVMIDSVQVFAQFIAVFERTGGLQRARLVDRRTKASVDVQIPRGASLIPWPNVDENPRPFLVAYTDALHPLTTVEVDVSTGAIHPVKVEPVPRWDPEGYETRRVTFTAKDGVAIPVSLAMKKGLTLPAPMLLRGYGAYGSASDPAFSLSDALLLERGVVIAEAHVRGGGEFGKPWHDAGRLANKPNTFSDFITCAEGLEAGTFTTAKQLIINGGSAGGLLMGVVLNERPELFHAAWVEVPFVDVINSMSDPSLPLTVGEYEEWGDPGNPSEYAVMRRYSPYDNVKPQAWPAMLVRTSVNDSQVLFHEPAKWVAKIRATKTDSRPLLLVTEFDGGGHSGKSGRYAALDDEARWLTFVLWQWGLE